MSNTTPTRKTAPTIADEIKSFMGRFVAFPDERQADALALWVLHTHVFDAAYCTPYLYVTSAEKQSGKTRVLEVLHLLCRNPLKTASASSGALYAAIENGIPVETDEGTTYPGGKPTIFLDEVDTIFTGAANEDLRGMLNEGYKQGGKILRQAMVDGQRVGVHYSVYCPKVLAGIDNGRMPDTIEDRCIRITLKRKRAGQEVERFMLRKIQEEADALAVKCHNWGIKNMDALLDSEPKLIEDISDRAFEIAEPLLAIADRLPGWHARARTALTFLLRGEVDALSPQALTLKAARDWLTETGADRIPGSVLCEILNLNGKQVGVYMNRYGINSRVVRVGGDPTRCYVRADLEDAFDRYLPAPDAPDAPEGDA